MQLRTWLTENEVTMVEFGEQIHRAQSVVSRICSKKQVPEPATALAIVRATKGIVSLADLYGLEPKYRCVGCKN